MHNTYRTESSLSPSSAYAVGICSIHPWCPLYAGCQGYVHCGLLSHGGPRIQAPEDHFESVAVFLVHPAVNGWIVTSVTHGQPMTGEPQIDNIR